MKIENWHDIAIEMAKDGLSKSEIYYNLCHYYEHSESIGPTYNAVKAYLNRNKTLWKKDDDTEEKMKKGYVESMEEYEPSEEKTHNEEKRVALQNQEPKLHDRKWDGNRTLKFAIIGDTQMGSKYSQLTYLHDFYDICQIEGITDIYHTGDITDGLKMRMGHEYELYENSADGQLNDVVKHYPMRDGITTHFITGNHDAALYKQVGMDIGKAIDAARPDLHYLGRDCAVVHLTPNCTLELRHPWDGTAYALSYKIQKMIEAMESDSKPNILAVGHYHKAEYLFYRNVHCLQTGCFQSQTPFTRGKGISVHMGGWIVTIHLDKDGSIQRFAPEFVPYYKSIKDDYKNF